MSAIPLRLLALLRGRARATAAAAADYFPTAPAAYCRACEAVVRENPDPRCAACGARELVPLSRFLEARVGGV